MRAIRVICDAGVCFATDVCNVTSISMIYPVASASINILPILVADNLTVAYLSLKVRYDCGSSKCVPAYVSSFARPLILREFVEGEI